MAYKIFIDGKEGTTGLKIYERFAGREDLEILQLDDEKRKNIDSRLEKIYEADISFLCLPDVAAKEIIEKAPEDAKILDTSTAHRTNPQWVYGFPELDHGQREKIKNAKRVSVPGCHATGFISLVNPLIALGIADVDYPFTCHSITGYSGGGKKMIGEYKNIDRALEFSSPRQYGLTQKHKHLNEMTTLAGIAYKPVFNPIVADYYSGMEVTVPLHNRLLNGVGSAQDIHNKMKEYYAGSKFIKVMEFGKEPESGFLGANKMSDKDSLQLYVFGHEEQTVLVALFDNLGKGASGAAVQCMNIMLGMPEDTGLTL